MRGAALFMKWVKSSGVLEEIRAAIAEQPHCKLVRLDPLIVDRSVHMHVGIDSEDAAGQNMVRETLMHHPCAPNKSVAVVYRCLSPAASLQVTYCGRVVMDVLNKRYSPADESTRIRSSLIEGGFVRTASSSPSVYVAHTFLPLTSSV